jgi:hypothetical protein
VHFREKRKNFIANVSEIPAAAPWGTFLTPSFRPYTSFAVQDAQDN